MHNDDPPSLEGLLRTTPSGDKSFPSPQENYFEKYARLARHLKETVHPNVNVGAAVAGQGEAANRGWLTDHGAEHIRTVTDHASRLVMSSRRVRLTPFESYLLLLAIQIHDTGNRFGRQHHSHTFGNLFTELQQVAGIDPADLRIVREIAMAHQSIDGEDEDTIGKLPYPADENQPRAQLLAAILRFADELSDDKTRANRFVLSDGIAPESEAYHLYADRLREVKIELPERIKLRFELDVEHTNTKIRKGNQRVYLIEEIERRLLKLYREFLYCSRFMRPEVHISRIDVEIGVYADAFMRPLWRKRFDLREQGYPKHITRLSTVTPEATLPSGPSLRKTVKRLDEGGLHESL